MRESRTYGSGRGACHEMHVPTATRAPMAGEDRQGRGLGLVFQFDILIEPWPRGRNETTRLSLPAWPLLSSLKVEHWLNKAQNYRASGYW